MSRYVETPIHMSIPRVMKPSHRRCGGSNCRRGSGRGQGVVGLGSGSRVQGPLPEHFLAQLPLTAALSAYSTYSQAHKD